MPRRQNSAAQIPRRQFLAGCGSAACFVLPVFGGRLGHPVLAPGPWFLDAARAAGLAAFRNTCGSIAKNYLIETLGSGVALFDYNNDGLVDVLLVNGSSFEILSNPGVPRCSSRLFRNNGDGTFTDVTRESKLVNEGWGVGVTVGDYNNDGFRDVFITNFGSNALFRNNGDGTFTNVTREAGLEGGNWSTGCAWGDYDGDGRLDLYVSRYVDFDRARIAAPGSNSYCHYQGVVVACGPQGLPGLSDFLYHNEGDGTFREVSAEVGARDTDRAYGLGVTWVDYDNDGWPDIYVANDSVPNFLWRNKRNGTFEEVGFEAGCAVSGDGRAQASMGIAVGDYDNDGWLDLLVTNFAEDYSTLYHNDRGRFEDVTYQAGLGAVAYKDMKWGTGFIDLDNDSWLDLFVANGHIYPQVDGHTSNTYKQHNRLFRNLRNGRFTALASAETGFGEACSSRGAAFGDLTNNGQIEIVVNNIDASPFLYKPAHTSSGAWVRFRLQGTKSNRDAIGARVSVTANGLTQIAEARSAESYVSASDVRLHFGLGQAKIIEHLEVRWPNRAVEQRTSLAVNREHFLVEGKNQQAAV